MNIRSLLDDCLSQIMLDTGIPKNLRAAVIASKNNQFGDYQANGAMAAAKAMKTNPREIAQNIADIAMSAPALKGIVNKIEIAGPGFINIQLDRNWLANQLRQAADSKRLLIDKKPLAERIVLDYSSPNLAKEMHIGHIRSTVIGDTIARIRTFQGDEVIRQNHVGDWGTQFGMLIAELEDQLGSGNSAELALTDLELFYQQSKKRFDEDTDFANRARDYVVRLQSGEASVVALWQKFRAVSLNHASDIYKRLNITLAPEDVHGESAYNPDLPVLVEELKQKKLIVEDEGAWLAYLDELADKEGNASAMIIQKKDGGYLYSTTDLAGMRYRTGHLNASRIEIFIDDRQSLHMKQVFTLARKAGFVHDDLVFAHRAFGKILGKDGKPFKTRSGGTVKLTDVLDEAIAKAANIVAAKNPDLNPSEIDTIAQKVGIGAIKYADLSKTRTHDYVFDWDAMLSFDGNTGPYLQYAYTRISSIFKKADIDIDSFSAPITLAMEQENALTLKLLRFSEVIDQVSEDAYPHILCNYLYETASLFMTFYECCPILKTGVSEEEKLSRLQISKATANTIALGLDLLGIEVMKKM